MARKFLYVIAILIVLAIASLFAYRLWGPQLIRFATVPSAAFEALPAQPANAYADPKLWVARPGMRGNPALWAPAGYKAATSPAAAIFYIHPTSYLGRTHWNAPLDDAEANDRAVLFLRGQATAFNESGAIWAPRYRQATFGAFLTSQAEAQKALDLAYRDIAAAFDQFLKEAGDRPIILAGHSQGALHLTRLLRDRVAGTPLAKRIVAAYVVGWPVSRTTDLPLLGLAECTRADQAGCLLSWQSFAEPAEPELIIDMFDTTTGFNGQPRKGTPMVCTNPLTGTADAAAPATANLGTLLPSADLGSATIVAGQVPARCAGRGLLLIGAGPNMGSYVLPGNNYHVYDYGLFWANVRADAARRRSRHSKPDDGFPLPVRPGPVEGPSFLSACEKNQDGASTTPDQLRGRTEGCEMITTDRTLFRDALPAGGRLIGLDVGTKTIGTALCDAGWSFASPATLIRRTKFQKDKLALAALIAEQQVKGIVIGLPLNLTDGSESPRSQSSRAFARNMEDLGLPIFLQDERWSTQAVTRTLIEQDASRAKRAELVDKMAAAYILQGAIDALVGV